MSRPSLTPTALLLALGALLLAPAAGTAAGHRSAVAQGRAVSQPAGIARASTFVASASECPGQSNLGASPQAQVEAMRCMTDFAREHAGLPPLADAPELDLSAAAKLGDVLGCDSFSHYACDRDFAYWMRESGYIAPESCWHAGENLAWGTGPYGTVRSIFQAWMRSPDHRRNILGEYRQLGVSLRVGDLEGQAGVHVWAQHFGSHCEASPAVG